MRPFNILKDKYFRKYSRFLNSVEGYIKPAKPWKARENVDNIAGALRETLKDEIADECDYYTASADIWTSKSKPAFISFTLHYPATLISRTGSSRLRCYRESTTDVALLAVWKRLWCGV
ncbi:hypothetical protein PHYSODRAFT_522819 [Phytophthora sojae]|uniref:Uncharacterized protein n=1 Tax=Phytophthora sojae (strain P6497) TaxID=1094619 RepID=G5A4E7_PHYSP|nr:hypothetical protein PHYSODRAFT_522819 [Phytophthora sojae]EGZ09548.1 hypothetical protein PHYSODRAFT_522819 [Phytophthora sojae]|eukprot:XP_009534409.1 hypothetical protein PHYSODRAFT_522819 [Phytophthora sojae]